MMRVHHRPVNWSAGHAESVGVGQFRTHGHCETSTLTFLRPVRFVYQANDVVALNRGQIVHILEALDGGDYGPGVVRPKSILQIFDSHRTDHAWIIAIVEVIPDLLLQVPSVYNDQNSGVVQLAATP